eukprot:jgi/Picsp_1/2700/NSC_00930-R1_amino acid permease
MMDGGSAKIDKGSGTRDERLDLNEELEEYVVNDKHGTVLTTTAHVICAIIGIGILALPYSVAYLGWIAGPLLIFFFYVVAVFSSRLLARVYLVQGRVHARYHHAVRDILGRRQALVLSTIQMTMLLLVMIAYAITGGISVAQVANIACTFEGKSQDEISNDPNCFGLDAGGTWKGILVFGAAELLLSQIKNLEESSLGSLVGSLCSLAYSLVAICLSFADLNPSAGSLQGIHGISTADKVFGVFNALGALASSFGVSLVLLEIQDTLKQPPNPGKQMCKTINVSLSFAFVLYMLVACSGYASQGDNVQGIILDSFESPRWALLVGYCAVLLHMLTAFQIFAQAVFDTCESHIKYWILRKRWYKSSKEKSAGNDHDNMMVDIQEEGEGEEQVAPLHLEDRTWTQCLGFDHIHSTALDDKLVRSLSRKILSEEFSMSRKVDSDANTFKPAVSRSLSTLVLRASTTYGLDTGLANESVPLNHDGVYLPFVYRLVLRSCIVLLVLLVSCIMPFFTAFVGLLGAINFFPLAIHFPFRCFQKTFKTSRTLDIILESLWWLYALITVVAGIGAIRTIIVGWSTYKIFGS